ncbi:hypothetical protein VE03_08605 [Pseudogymnoascus sp. 23342-1-I1]|nr:hypothetical protein VE03_08605 [Pseudogymnoascus sp. 23342-1-I1]
MAFNTQPSDSDLTAIWDEAIRKYNNTTGVKYKFETGSNPGEKATELRKKFIDFRHNDKRGDKIRTSLGKLSGVIQTLVGMAGNIASPSFPPAPTIGQALVFVLGACKNVSDKYDQIVGFYETVIIFCERMSLLQERMPPENAFRSQLVGLLGTILNMCGIAETFMHAGRMLTFTKTLFQSDDGLAGAYAEFNNQMSYFESAIITATLGISVQTGRGVENLQERYQEQESLLRTVLWRVSISPRQEIAFGVMEGRGNDSEREYRSGHSRGDNSGNDDTAYENKLTDLGQRRFGVLEGTLKQLSTGVELSLRQHLEEMGYAYIQNTCVWLHETDDFKDFKEGKTTRLIIKGGPWSGKSMLLFYIFCSLAAQPPKAEERILTAYFSFADRSGKHFTVREMISCCALQFAMQDSKYRKRLVEALKGREENRQHICNCTDKRDMNHLCLEILLKIASEEIQGLNRTRMLLVVDAAYMEKNNDEFKEILSDPKISVVSDDLGEEEQPDKAKPAVIDLTFMSRRENATECKNDLKIFAKSRLQTLQRLSMLPEHRQTIIIDEVSRKADSFPYIEHTLHGLNNSTWFKVQWDKLPQSTDYIYRQLFSSSAKGYQQRRKILIWLAYAKHRFSLGAIRRLHKWIKEKNKPEDGIKEKSEREDGEDIDIDDELDGPLSRILSLSPNFSIAMEHNYQDSKINEYDNTSFLGFSEPSLRAFFLHIASEDSMPPIVAMFELVTMVLTDSKSDADTSAADVELFSYAASSWSDYLLKLEPHSAKSITAMIYNVLHVGKRRNDALAKIESYTKIDEINADKVAKSIQDWAKQCLQEDPTPIDEGLKSFCENVSDSCNNVFIEIAEGYARNWRFSEFPVEAYTCFHRAYKMLRYSGNEEMKGEITAESFRKVADKFWRESYSAQDYICLAMALRYEGHYDEAILNAKKGFEADENDSWTKFELYDRIGRINFGEVEDKYPMRNNQRKLEKNEEAKLQKVLNDLEKAIKHGEEAAKHREGYPNDEKRQEKLRRTMQLKLKIEVHLSSRTGPKKHILGKISEWPVIFFDDIVRELAERTHWDSINDLLNKVTDTQLADGCRKETHKFIQYSAFKCSAKGNTGSLSRIEILYDKAIETLEEQQNGQLLGSTLLWRAIFWKFYRGSDGEKERREKSVQDLLLVLDTKSRASFVTKTFASWQLMDNYFEEFRLPLADEDVEGYLSRKEKAQGSMEQVMKWFSGIQDPDFEVSLSPLSIPLAIVYRDTKQEKKFFEEANKAFYGCYKALTDNVIYNDRPSYLILAKILALVGLNEQAEAAFKKWCSLGSNLNADDGGQRRKADRKRSRRKGTSAEESSKINVECNGPCGSMMDNFYKDTSIYLCYYCVNTVLCNECQKRISTEYKHLCGKGHRYITASKETCAILAMDKLEKVWKKKWKEFFAVL